MEFKLCVNCGDKNPQFHCCNNAAFCGVLCYETDKFHKFYCGDTILIVRFNESIIKLLVNYESSMLPQNSMFLLNSVRTLQEKFGNDDGFLKFYESVHSDVIAVIAEEKKTEEFSIICTDSENFHLAHWQDYQNSVIHTSETISVIENICDKMFPLFRRHIEILLIDGSYLNIYNFTQITQTAFAKLLPVLQIVYGDDFVKSNSAMIQMNLLHRAISHQQNFKCVTCSVFSKKMCSRCATPYCSESCQKIDWPHHKSLCH